MKPLKPHYRSSHSYTASLCSKLCETMPWQADKQRASTRFIISGGSACCIDQAAQYSLSTMQQSRNIVTQSVHDSSDFLSSAYPLGLPILVSPISANIHKQRHRIQLATEGGWIASVHTFTPHVCSTRPFFFSHRPPSQRPRHPTIVQGRNKAG